MPYAGWRAPTGPRHPAYVLVLGGPTGQILRRRTRRTSWLSPLDSTRLARERVGRMFSTRLGPLISRQMRLAVATASSSESTAYRWKYESGSEKAVSRRRRKRSTYHVRTSSTQAST